MSHAARRNRPDAESALSTDSVRYGAATPRAAWIQQGAPSLSSVIGSTDMPSHEVSDKSLRAG